MLTHSGSHHPEIIELLAQRGDDAIPPQPTVSVPVARPRRTGLRVVSVVAGLALMAAAALVAGREVTGSLNPADWPRHGMTIEARSASQLADLMVDAPDGYSTPPAVLELETGPIDKAGAVADESVPGAVTAIEAGYVRGHNVAWARSETQFVAAGVYQFRDESAAKSYESANLDDPVIGDVRLVPAAAPDVPGAHAFTYSTADSPLTVEAVIYTRGAYVVMVVAAGVDGPEASELMADLAEDQHARLSKLPWLEGLL